MTKESRAIKEIKEIKEKMALMERMVLTLSLISLMEHLILVALIGRYRPTLSLPENINNARLRDSMRICLFRVMLSVMLFSTMLFR